MFNCEKCGAILEDGMKFCDKCGSEIPVTAVETPAEENQEVVFSSGDDNQNYEFEITEGAVAEGEEKAVTPGIKGFFEKYLSYIPHPFTKPGDRTALILGLGSLGILSILYIVCFFSFMPEICLPVALPAFFMYSGGVGNSMGGASSLWLIFYFVFNLFPIAFAVLAFLNKKYRLYAIFVSAFTFVLTFFTFVAWLICEPSSFVEAVSTYQSGGSVAWFVFVDALSELWYLKMILSLASVFGFGVDYLVNKGK